MTTPSDAERARPIAFFVIAALAAALLVHVLHHCGAMRSRWAPSVTLESRHVRFTLFRDGRVRVTTKDGARAVDGEMVTANDDGVTALALSDLVTDGLTRARARSDRAGDVLFSVDSAHDALDVVVHGGDDAGGASRDETVGVRVETLGREVFLSGRGDLADLASETGTFAVLSDPVHPVGFVAAGRPMHVSIEPSLTHAHEMAMRAMIPVASADLTIAVAGARRGGPWAVLFDRAHVVTRRVKGFVTGAPGVTHVVGLDDQGTQQMRVATDIAGRFDFRAPITVRSWYASASATRTSAPVIYPPGTPWDLKLDVSDGGELHVRAVDADTHEPITVRLLVHGIDGTLDPSFGPDYRASGAGPLIDALRGEVTTPLPAGKYRVAVTKGIEWSIDSRVVEIDPGKRVDIDLAPRHVVPTPGELGCDFHVHARPSFDSPVSPEDRVLSLVAAGIDFAVPSEHNIVGNYGPAIQALGLQGKLSFVPGVEITTYTPRFGHFGLFPYPLDKLPPPFRHTNVNRVFAAARAGDPKRVLVVNHPRLAHDIGYFSAVGYEPGSPPPRKMRLDFDAIEVFNGYESASIARVETVLKDYYALLNAGHRYAATGSSDSHRIQYQWAGYPRTMVRIGDAAADEEHFDPLAVVAALKAGHATVTSGPIVELTIEGARPGGDVYAQGSQVSGHLLVRAAPWVDVTSAKIVVGGDVVQTIDVPSRPMLTGPEPGTLEEAAARTVRLDTDVHVDLAKRPTWVVVVVKGTRRMDDILPFMPIQPFAVTNPIFVH